MRTGLTLVPGRILARGEKGIYGEAKRGKPKCRVVVAIGSRGQLITCRRYGKPEVCSQHARASNRMLNALRTP